MNSVLAKQQCTLIIYKNIFLKNKETMKLL